MISVPYIRCSLSKCHRAMPLSGGSVVLQALKATVEIWCTEQQPTHATKCTKLLVKTWYYCCLFVKCYQRCARLKSYQHMRTAGYSYMFACKGCTCSKQMQGILYDGSSEALIHRHLHVCLSPQLCLQDPCGAHGQTLVRSVCFNISAKVRVLKFEVVLPGAR